MRVGVPFRKRFLLVKDSTLFSLPGRLAYFILASLVGFPSIITYIKNRVKFATFKMSYPK